MSIGMTRKREREAAEKAKMEEKVEDFTCPICGKEYKTEKGLNAHMTSKHKDGE